MITVWDWRQQRGNLWNSLIHDGKQSAFVVYLQLLANISHANIKASPNSKNNCLAQNEDN
jgi:hypothetical protein